ncbi:DUF3489 domain-containing protein [Phreatobacter sp.]|uniref:DUF3489 domain-containing protein n=1 Tax=Phreatobacter sp. TaxID=1966341 RepID=UPI003F6E8984
MSNRTKASNATGTRKGASTKASQTAERAPARPEPGPARAPSRLATIISHLQSPTGASIAELCTATGWQAHSIRGAIAGALKRKGHVVTSSIEDGVRRYKITAAA